MGSAQIPAIIYRRLEVDIFASETSIAGQGRPVPHLRVEATRLLTLSANDFQTFLNWPQKELSWDAQPLYYEEDGKRVYRGVLILGEGRADGVFAYDAGEHFVYLPGARAVVDSNL